MSEVRHIDIEKQSLLPAISAQTSRNSLVGKYAEGNFNQVKDIEKVKSWKEIELTSYETLRKINNYESPTAAILKGFIDVPENGVYEFQTNFDQFYIGEKLLINNDGEVKRASRNNAMIALSKGKHPVKIIYLNNNIGGYPQSWNEFVVGYKRAEDEKFTKLKLKDYMY